LIGSCVKGEFQNKLEYIVAESDECRTIN